MQFEVVGVQKVHIFLSAEAVDDERNSAVRQRLIAAVKIHNVDVVVGTCTVRDVLFLDGVACHDKVDDTAGTFFDVVDCVLDKSR